MQFLKILFWCLLAFVAAVFTVGNWATVPIHLWSGLIADVNLPLLLLVTFLIGFLPTFLYHRWVRWRLRQRLATSQRTVADLATAAPVATAPAAIDLPLPAGPAMASAAPPLIPTSEPPILP